MHLRQNSLRYNLSFRSLNSQIFSLNSSREYDYIIAGAGCSGLSLLMHMIESGKFSQKKILLIDKELKTKNDRTWCFWETTPGLFENCVYKQWDKMWFHDTGYSKLMDISPYRYKMIRGIDFYNHCFEVIKNHGNVEIVYGDIQEIKNEDEKASLLVDGNKIEAQYIFSSIVFDKPALKKKERYLLQHFKGWIIETKDPVFNPGEATMMDFRVDQNGGTTFVYIMPFSETKALVEYTLFTGTLLEQLEYDEALKNYIGTFLQADNYIIREKEFGVIPMTNHVFAGNDGRVINIGTAGGQTKASSGYTFMFIQKHSAAIVEQLIKKGTPYTTVFSKRFHFYDSVLLEVLAGKKLSARNIFTPIIKKNKPQHLLRFMDNESSLFEDLKIISSLPTWPFFKAALKQL